MEMVFNNSLWRQGRGEGTGPRRAMAGMSPQELAVPSCSTDVSAGQPGSPSPSAAGILCAQPHKHGPFNGGTGEEEEILISCSPVLMVS